MSTKRFRDLYGKNDPKPEYVAISLIKREGGWSVVKLTCRGAQVIEDELTEPDLRSIALERFKILAAREVLKV